jgi:hypothetical protein
MTGWTWGAGPQGQKWNQRIGARLCGVNLMFIRRWPLAWVHSEKSKSTKGSTVKMLIDLFSTDYGLMSLAVILITLVMGVFFLRMFLHKMNHNE